MTHTMLCTTVEVVCSPTLRASRETDMPMRQAIIAMKSAKTGALARPITTALTSSVACSRFDKRRNRDAELQRADQHAPRDAGDVADEHQQRQAQGQRSQPRNHQHLHR